MVFFTLNQRNMIINRLRWKNTEKTVILVSLLLLTRCLEAVKAPDLLEGFFGGLVNLFLELLGLSGALIEFFTGKPMYINIFHYQYITLMEQDLGHHV